MSGGVREKRHPGAVFKSSGKIAPGCSFREFGQNGNRLQFSDTALIALTTAPDPQAALAEAEALSCEISSTLINPMRTNYGTREKRIYH